MFGLPLVSGIYLSSWSIEQSMKQELCHAERGLSNNVSHLGDK
jgi:hypothetical protein